MFFEKLQLSLKEREKFSKLIYKLKKEGFIKEDKDKKLLLTQKEKMKSLSLKKEYEIIEKIIINIKKMN